MSNSCSSPVICGIDYLQRTSADHPTALEMMRDVSQKLASVADPLFTEWDNPKLLTASFQRLLEASEATEERSMGNKSNSDPQMAEDVASAKPEMMIVDVCSSTEASSSRPSRPSLLSSCSSSILQV